MVNCSYLQRKKNMAVAAVLIDIVMVIAMPDVRQPDVRVMM